ncbi:ATP-binding protein, partial [bacterium]|nr:ATP-binding protein [bacterium]
IGMAPNEADVIAWKKTYDSDPNFPTKEAREESTKFRRFVDSHPHLEEKRKSHLQRGEISKATEIVDQLVAEYIRKTHAERSRQILKDDWEGQICYRDTDLTVDLAAICFSHNEDPLSLLDLELQRLVGPGDYVCIRSVALFLRLADILDFDGKRTPSLLLSHLNVRNPVSLSEWKKHRSVEAWEINPNQVLFHATCDHPAIEASIHAFFDLIDRDLSGCNNVLRSINESSRISSKIAEIKIPLKVDRSKVLTRRDIEGRPLYTYQQTQFNLSKRQVIELLMGTKLYGNPEVALRELLQNSIDACLLRRALEKSWGNSYDPEISVIFESRDNGDFLFVEDNGTGMDQYIVDSYYSKIGSSFYKSSDFYNQRAESKADFQPTSRFGIGILSCFMVSDSLTVETRRVIGPHDASAPLKILIEGQDSIFWIKPGQRTKPGTKTELLLRDSHPWKEMNAEDFTKSVGNLIPNPPFKITIRSDKNVLTRDNTTFGRVKASTLKQGDWRKHENVRTIDLTFSEPAKGFSGSALVAFLQKKRKPVDSIELKANSVRIDEDDYNLERSMRLAGQTIDVESSSITIDDNGGISPDSSSSELFRSRSKLSFHGIEVPMDLFPPYWRAQKNQVKLQWPIPVLLVIDISPLTGIELNSSRSQIIHNPEWDVFEECLASEVLTMVRAEVSMTYWNQLSKVLKTRSCSQPFKTALRKVSALPGKKPRQRKK